MAFAAFLKRIFGKTPVWLVRIETPAGAFNYTTRLVGWATSPDKPSADYPAGIVFANAPDLVINQIVETTQAERDTASITLRTKNPAVQAIAATDDYTEVSVTIWQGWVGDPDEEYVVAFRGRVVRPAYGVFLAQLDLASALTSMARQSAGEIAQELCDHTHYHTNVDGTGCGLNIEDWLQAAQVTSVDGARLTVPLAGLQPDGTFTLGEFRWGGGAYLIASHAGSILTIDRVVPGLAAAVAGAAQDCDIAPGCDGSLARCEAFDNVYRYGGLPFAPKESPYDGRSIIP